MYDERDVMTQQTRFRDHYGLAALPYFDLREGNRIALADPELGPAIDVHTHLAHAYGRKFNIDLWASHDRIKHYFPLNTPLDLDVYQNKNFSDARLKELKRDLTLTSLTSRGIRRTHTAANLTREMAELGVISSVLLPIDFPVLSPNADAYLKAAAKSDSLLSLGSVHPYARNVGDKLQAQKDAGARGIKVHPAVQMVAPDNKRAMALYRACADLDLPVLFHCGPVDIEPPLGRYLSQLKHYWRAVADNPDTTFVLGHSGALQMEAALDLCKHYPNVYLETSSQGLPNVRRIVAEAPPERVMFGSDWPFYHQATPLAKVFIATEGQPETRARVLWQNAARLFEIGGVERRIAQAVSPNAGVEG